MSGKIKLTPTQRSAAIDNAGRSMVLRSGAGCGKTFVLARRYVELLRRYRGPDSPVRRLVALTFTEKAALEMLQRVRAMLGELATGAEGARKKRLQQWIDELPEGRISTTHSFCASLLRSHAVEAGIDPNFAVCADDLLVAQMQQEACDQALLAAVETDQNQVAQLLQAVPYDTVVTLLREMLDRRELWTADDYQGADRIMKNWRSLWHNEQQTAWRRLESDTALAQEVLDICQEPCSDPKDKLLAKRRELAGVVNEILADPAARTEKNFQDVHDFKVGAVGAAKAWGSREAVGDVRRRLNALKIEILQYEIYAEEPGEADRLAAGALASVASLATDAQRRYAADKRRRGLLDFTDLITATHQLVQSNPAVRKQLGQQIDQLLIDECQDTDAFQLETLEKLVSTGDGHVFIVGDPKQSIYRFRGADVEVFEDLCSRLGEGRSEDLDLSFRAHEPGAAFVNHVFAPMMGKTYRSIRAHRKIAPPHPTVEILLADASGGIETAADANEAQAGLTAQRISEMVRNSEPLVWDAQAGNFRGVELRDIVILFSRMTNSLKYERELQKRDVPYYVVAGIGFFRQQEVFDILNALRVIDNPLDDIALIGVLRSGLIGLDDNALMHIAEECGCGPYLEKLNHADLSGRLSPGQLDALTLARDLLSRLAGRKDAVGIDELVEQLLDETAYEAVLLSRFGGKRMLGNVRQLLDRARTADGEGLALGDFISQMNELVLSESRYEQAVVAGETDNVVRLMTVHKAKGLEFPVVFVPDLNAAPRGFVGDLLHRRDWGWTFKLKIESDNGRKSAEAAPLSFRAAKQAEGRDLNAENVRRLYVAVTRHKDYLVLLGADWRTKDGRFKNSDNHLRDLDEVLGITKAIEAKKETIPYGQDRFEARVRRIVPVPARYGHRQPAPLHKALQEAADGDKLAEVMLRRAKGHQTPQMVGPLPSSVGQVDIAVTALSEFDYCPMLYRWRYELRVPEAPPNAGLRPGAFHELRGLDPKLAGPSGRLAAASLDPATLGTLFHGCMELLDFTNPQPVAALVEQVVHEMGLEDQADTAALTAQLEDMLARFRAHELWRELAGAKQALRELDFVLHLGRSTLRGQIDLLYQGPDDRWHIVDYKSDRTASSEVAAHARRYELQMLAYALAGGKHLGGLTANLEPAVADATLYFLRPACGHRFDVTATTLDSAAERIDRLASQLITSRRRGVFERTDSPSCRTCPYAPLCS